MVISRFFRPKWQHPNERVRRRAIEALTPAELAVLTEVARNEEVPALRRLAIARLADLALIEALAREDADEEVRRYAQERYRRLLAGGSEDCPDLATRLECLARSEDAALLEHLVRQADEQALRMAALARLERPSMLVEVASEDPDAEVRLAAVERLERANHLEQVIERCRRRDKRVTRLARERLQVLIEAAERPARVCAECEAVLTALGRLQGARWEPERRTLEQLARRWEQVSDEPEAQDYRARYEAARETFLSEYAAYQAALAEEEARLGPQREARRRLLSEMEGLGQRLAAEAVPQRKALAEIEGDLCAARATWSELAPLPASEQEEWEGRFAEASRQAEEALETRAREASQRRDFERARARAERLLGQTKALREAAVATLEQRLTELQAAGGLPDQAAQEQALAGPIGALRERLGREAGRRKSMLGELPGLLARLEAALEEGRLKEAAPLREAIDQRLEGLRELDAPKSRLDPLRRRYQALSPELRKLLGWRSWGADHALEQLCEAMEALDGSELPPPEIAQQVRAARAEWKHLQGEGARQSHALWSRFNAAAERAYAPCEAYFQEQARGREQSMAQRQALCEELQAFVREADWSAMDWRAAQQREREARQQWRTLGPVDRRHKKALEQRFAETIAGLSEPLAEERARNRRQREALIERIRPLAEMVDVRQAVEECKRLQKDWKTTVPGRRGEEKALWEAYREACDAVFARRQEEREAREQAAGEAARRRAAICEQTEALAGCEPEAQNETRARLQRLRAEWGEAGAPGRGEAQRLEQRFRASIAAAEAHLATLREGAYRQELEGMRARAALCAQAEAAAEGHDHGGDAIPKEPRASWQALGTLDDREAEGRLEGRFARAERAAEGDPESRRLLREAYAAGLAERLGLCLQLEVLAGVESPPEVHEARMRYQVERLARAMSERRPAEEEAAQLERAWYLADPAAPDRSGELEERFERALAASREVEPIEA